MRYGCLRYGVAGDGATDAAGVDVAAGDAVGDTEGEGDGTGVAVVSGSVDCKTERVPVIPGNESVSAISMKAAAAPIVIFASTLAVPRGPNAALETPPENKSPVPDLPGCNKITTISTTHDSMNNPYRV